MISQGYTIQLPCNYIINMLTVNIIYDEDTTH